MYVCNWHVLPQVTNLNIHTYSYLIGKQARNHRKAAHTAITKLITN